MNDFYYELKPLFWTLLALFGIKLSHGTPSAVFFAIMLVTPTAMIVRARLMNRGYMHDTRVRSTYIRTPVRQKKVR